MAQYSGLFTLSQQFEAIGENTWPIAYGPNGPPDPYFEYNTLLLNGDGTNGAQNNTFLDSSTNNFTITRNGNTTQGSFSPYGSNWGVYIGAGTTNYLRNSTSVSLSGSFTYETWVNVDTSQLNVLGCIGDEQASTGMCFFINSSGNIRIYTNSGYINNITGTVIPKNTWTHIAFVRDSGTITTYVNGVSVNTVSHSATLSGVINVGNEVYNAGNNPSYYGYASNVRLTNTAVYTSGFTPSTTPLTAVSGTQFLSCQSNRFIDNSSNNSTIVLGGTPSVQRFSPFNPTAPYSTSVIGGSGYFDGSGDYLSSPNVNLSTVDFCLECWAYATNTSGQVIFAKGASDANEDFRIQTLLGDNKLYIDWAGGGDFYEFSNAGLKPYCWNHIAVVRISSVIYAYVNGIRLAGSQALATITNNYTTWNIGGTSFAANSGYVCDARITTGSSVYSGASFTPPSSPLSPVSGTQLLLNMTNAGIPDLAMQNNLETVGNAQVSTSVKKYGTGSLAFDGTGDYLRTPTTNFALPFNGDFTIEFWVNFNSTSTDQTVLGQWQSPTFWEFYYLSNTALRFYYSSSGFISLGALSTGTWYYITAVRSGSTITVYLNGVSQGTATSSSVIGSSTLPFGIGSESPWNSLFFNGYIDDLRITNGLARYTTTFTPPTAALPTYQDRLCLV